MKTALALLIAIAWITGVAHASEPPELPQTPQEWRAAAERDVRAAYEALYENHVGVVDPGNPGFLRELERARDAGLRLAARVQDAAGYAAAINRFDTSLQDGHAGVFPTLPEGALPKRRWPGFVPAWRGDRMMVFASLEGGPPAGAEIVACDGQPIATLARRTTFRFRGRVDEPGQWWVQARNVLVDDGNPFIRPPRACTFRFEGRRWTERLSWRETDDQFVAWRVRSYNGDELPVGLSERGDRLAWIAMPTFTPDPAGAEAYHGIARRIAEDRALVDAARAVVLDLRHNGGGTSEWASVVARALWGEAPVAAALAASTADVTIDYRVSPGNVAYWRPVPALLRERGLVDMAADVERLSEGMRLALEAGQATYRPEKTASARAFAESAFRTPVFVIVPGQCASACLDALDLFTRFPNVTLIGAPSSADTLYMEVRNAPLPSGLAAAVIPMKVWNGRPRGAGEVYEPAITVTALDWSTEAFVTVVDAALRGRD